MYPYSVEPIMEVGQDIRPSICRSNFSDLAVTELCSILYDCGRHAWLTLIMIAQVACTWSPLGLEMIESSRKMRSIINRRRLIASKALVQWLQLYTVAKTI